MLTRLVAVGGGLSPQSSEISVSVDTIWPGSSSRHAKRERHFAAPMLVQSAPDLAALFAVYGAKMGKAMSLRLASLRDR